MTATDTAPAPNPGAGLTGSATHGPSSNSLVLEVARKFGVNPFKQFFEMLRLSRSRNKIVPAEYFWFQLYRPDLTMAEKREYVGEKTSFELNLRLAPPTFTNMRNFLADKAGFTTMVAGFGLPTTHLQAAFSPNRGFGTLPTLRTAEEIRAFLTGPARYPLFGKPIRGLQAQGSVMIEAVQGDAAHPGHRRARAPRPALRRDRRPTPPSAMSSRTRSRRTPRSRRSPARRRSRPRVWSR